MTIQTSTWRENNAIWLKAHAVKHEPIALQLLEQKLELGLQLPLGLLDLDFSLEISGPKVVLLCTFSLYRAVRAPIGVRPHQPHG